MSLIFLIQARLGSSRLPNKILKHIFRTKTLLDFSYNRLLISKHITSNDITVLTTNSRIDDKLCDHLFKKNIKFYRGLESNVFERFYNFIIHLNEDNKYFFRICADNPFIEPIFLDKIINFIKHNDHYDYISYGNKLPGILTGLGLFAEAIKTETFKRAYKLNRDSYQNEHVTPIFYENKNIFKCKFFSIPQVLNSNKYRFTVDTIEDLDVIRSIISKLNIMDFSYTDILNLIMKDEIILSKMKMNILNNQKRIIR